MVDIAHIQESLRLLEAAKADDLHALQSMRHNVRQALRILGTESVGEALSGVLESLPSLAQELGKATPQVQIDDNGYRLRREAGGALKNVFMHLLRNSVDHGLETADVRTAQGKPVAGAINIEVGMHGETVQITLSDDGRGLALQRIRGMALEKGWIAADQELSDEEIAEMIFRPGFSTADKVTEVSGRGVGMDAVRDFLRREHGSIALRFTDDHKGAGFRQFQTIVSLPASLAVDTAGVPARGDADQLELDTLAD
jgi:chemotaxis protein histidine kinase CheA